MDQLIPAINKLQDVFNSLGFSAIDLPQLVVVGSQSTGKSSVLEHIVGRDFLPRGSDIVTRRPLILQLYNVSSASGGNEDDVTEWGEFTHIPEEIFTDFEKIRAEIERETNRLAGTNKGVSSEPIGLRIFSPKVLNLTLVDLPGITKVPVGDQPTNIEKLIKKIVLEYVSNPNSIILAVTPANMDIANSEALKIAREVDPEGLRTIGILTKVDLMDEGTDALDMIHGRVYPLKLGYIPVVNRSQKDIKQNKKIAHALKAEEEYFKTHPAYKDIAQRCGTPYLARTLNKTLVNHIREKLPGLKRKIEVLTVETQNKFLSFGGTFGEEYKSKGPTLLRLLNQYASNFVDSVDGNSGEISLQELRGGASIYLVFNGTYMATLESIDPNKEFTTQEIRTAIRNSSGIRPALFVSERSFENLAKKAIQKLYEPSYRCVEMVCYELQRIIEKCSSLELSRYPVLQQQIYEVVKKILRERLKPTNQMVQSLVDIEIAYINTSHPDFKAIAAVNQFLEKKAEPPKGRTPTHPTPPVATPVDTRPKTNSFISPMETDSDSQPQKGGLFSYLWGKNDSNGSGNQPPQGAGLASLPTPNVIRAPMTEEEEMEIRFIRTLLTSYFNIVKRNIGDTVPKSIMHFLVNFVKQNLHNKLIEELYKEDKIEELLQEDKEVAAQRMNCKAMLDVLKRATTIINQVSDNDL